MIDLVSERAPDWAPGLSFALETWRVSHEGANRAREVLDPVRERLQWAWLVYPADRDAMDRADRLIGESGFGVEELATMIDPGVAGAELLRHALLEIWLECDQDLEAFFDACGRVFAREGFQRRLVQAYLLRFAPFKGAPSPLLLSNERLLPLIVRMGEAHSGESSPLEEAEADDTLAFEIFRRIISPRLDPLSPAGAETAAEILASREDELVALRSQCDKLSEQLNGTQPDRMRAVVDEFMRRHVADDLAAVLRLSDRAKTEYLAQVASDKIAWTSLITTVVAATQGAPQLTLAGGIGAIATAIAKGVNVGWQHHKDVRDNPYRLIRRLGDAVPDDFRGN